MTYPIPNYTRVWVRGRIIDLGKAVLQEDNYGLALPVTFSPSPKVLLNAGTNQIISTASFKITPAAQDGYFAIQLPATDDPDINPTNFTYAVKEPTGRSYNIIVPAATPLLNSPGDPLHGQPVIDLITVVPSPPAGAGSVQLLTGLPGRGISSASFVSGDLVLTFTDSTTQNLGPVGGTISSATDLNDADAHVGQIISVAKVNGGVVSGFGLQPAPTKIHPGPASGLVVCPDDQFPMVTTLTGWTGNSGSGSDVDGGYLTQNETSDVTTTMFPVTPGGAFLYKLRAAGALPNNVQVNYYNAAGGFVSSAQSYLFTSGAYTPPVSARAVTQAKTVVVPATTTISQAALVIKKYVGQNANPLRIYGWFTADTRALPALPKYRTPMPYRGVGIQSIRSNHSWIDDDPIITQQAITEHLTFLRDTLHLRPGDALRVFLNADAGMTRDGSGVPTGFDPRVWTNLTALVTTAKNMRLKLIPVLFYPFPFSSGTPNFDRTSMTDTAKAAGYRARARELAGFLEQYETVVALDIINEYAWSLSFTPGGGATYTPQQAAACYENLSAGVREGSSKPLLASCATGKDAVATLLFQDPDSYDVLSWHSYNGAVAFYQPQYDKPVVSGEFGPDVTQTDPTIIYNQTVPVMKALPDLVSAAWFWCGYAVTQPTAVAPGSVINQPLIDSFAAFNPAVDARGRSWPRSLSRLEDTDLTGSVDGSVLTYDGAAGKYRPKPRTPALPAPAPALYFFPVSGNNVGTSPTHGIGVLRSVPWRVDSAMSIQTIGAEITAAGEAGALLRLGIYADNGFGYPGALVLDAGTVAADATGVKSLAVSVTALSAGLYWLVAVVQAVVTTQPTLRTVAGPQSPLPIYYMTTPPSAGQTLVGIAADPVTGALPTTFPTSGYGSGTCARIHLRSA